MKKFVYFLVLVFSFSFIGCEEQVENGVGGTSMITPASSTIDAGIGTYLTKGLTITNLTDTDWLDFRLDLIENAGGVFQATNNTCSNRLRVGDFCTITLNYTSAVPGGRTAIIRATVDNGTVEVASASYGVNYHEKIATIDIIENPSNIKAFNVLQQNAVQHKFTIINTGNIATDNLSIDIVNDNNQAFNIKTAGCNGKKLLNNESCEIAIDVWARYVGGNSATLLIRDGKSIARSVPLSIEGLGVTRLDFSTGTKKTDAISFGVKKEKNTASATGNGANNDDAKTIAIHNIGSNVVKDLKIDSIPEGFTAKFNCVDNIIELGSNTCTITVDYKTIISTAYGRHEGELVIKYDTDQYKRIKLIAYVEPTVTISVSAPVNEGGTNAKLITFTLGLDELTDPTVLIKSLPLTISNLIGEGYSIKTGEANECISKVEATTCNVVISIPDSALKAGDNRGSIDFTIDGYKYTKIFGNKNLPSIALNVGDFSPTQNKYGEIATATVTITNNTGADIMNPHFTVAQAGKIYTIAQEAIASVCTNVLKNNVPCTLTIRGDRTEASMPNPTPTFVLIANGYHYIEALHALPSTANSTLSSSLKDDTLRFKNLPINQDTIVAFTITNDANSAPLKAVTFALTNNDDGKVKIVYTRGMIDRCDKVSADNILGRTASCNFAIQINTDALVSETTFDLTISGTSTIENHPFDSLAITGVTYSVVQ